MAEQPEDVDRRRVVAFGQRVRQVREEHGLSQEQLAQDAGVHRAEVGFVERGEREVGISKAWRLADGLDVSLDELVAGLDGKAGGREPARRSGSGRSRDTHQTRPT